MRPIIPVISNEVLYQVKGASGMRWALGALEFALSFMVVTFKATHLVEGPLAGAGCALFSCSWKWAWPSLMYRVGFRTARIGRLCLEKQRNKKDIGLASESRALQEALHFTEGDLHPPLYPLTGNGKV